jgi:CubicO group peptidase (beta-lactamase class C family)
VISPRLVPRCIVVLITSLSDLGVANRIGFADESRPPIERRLQKLNDVVTQAGKQGVIIGAQIATGSADSSPGTLALGSLTADNRRRVDDETQFCIGSCSKPFAAACILTLTDEKKLELDKPVDRWIPEMSNLALKSGQSVARAPTLRELLAHRGGIYSQNLGQMTPAQTRAIRDFRLSLWESVKIITRQPLIAMPGEKYAYSGAGYCLVGFVAERAAERGFEQLLQTKFAQPLGLNRTTYFPSPREINIALPGTKGGVGRSSAYSGAPHMLRTRLKLPLIGGSIYSTAAETARFARMLLNRGKVGERTVLSPNSWAELTRQQFRGQSYGLGWGLTLDGGEVSSMRHRGALLGYRSLIVIDFKNHQYTVVHWTLANPQHLQSNQFQRRLEQQAFSNL